jgi:hypothetical protein
VRSPEGQPVKPQESYKERADGAASPPPAGLGSTGLATVEGELPVAGPSDQVRSFRCARLSSRLRELALQPSCCSSLVARDVAGGGSDARVCYRRGAC